MSEFATGKTLSSDEKKARIRSVEKYEVSGDDLIQMHSKIDEIRREMLVWDEGLTDAIRLISRDSQSVAQFVAKVSLVAKGIGTVVNGPLLAKLRGMPFALAEKRIEGQEQNGRIEDGER